MKITVVLEAFVQTSYETYTHKYRTVNIEVPDDGNEWHVAGEMEALGIPVRYVRGGRA